MPAFDVRCCNRSQSRLFYPPSRRSSPLQRRNDCKSNVRLTQTSHLSSRRKNDARWISVVLSQPRNQPHTTTISFTSFSSSSSSIREALEKLKKSPGTSATMTEILDDKAPYVIPFILSNLEKFQAQVSSSSSSSSRHSPSTNKDDDASNVEPFIIGLNGVQGAGKSVLVSIIRTLLESPPYNLPTAVFSLDDLYLTHEDQVNLAKSHPDNPLLQHRGQPSTHDIPLALRTFESLKQGKPTKIPAYNKAAFSGQGDRIDSSEWKIVNDRHSEPTARPIRVVIFEGWCVGFRPHDPGRLEDIYNQAVQELEQNNNVTAQGPKYLGRLAHNTLKSVVTINEALKQHDQITDQFDAFIHIDAADPQYVYKWRLQQEEGLRRTKGSGMTDEQVKTFVDGYYPAYELYTETLREGVFNPRLPQIPSGDDTGVDVHADQSWRGRQLRLIVGQDRKVKDVVTI